MSGQPDHEFEVLETDQTVPPRPEEDAADLARSGADPTAAASTDATAEQ